MRWLVFTAISMLLCGCATTRAASAPRAPAIELEALARPVAHDGRLYVAAYVSLDDFVAFAQSRPDLSPLDKQAVRAGALQAHEAARDPAPFITPLVQVPDWVLAGSGAYLSAKGRRVFLGVGSVSNGNRARRSLAENLARAELSTMLQHAWDRIVPPTETYDRPSWVAEVPMQVGLDGL